MKFRKLVANTFVCLSLLLAAATPAGCATEPGLKDVFKNDFRIGAAVNYNQVAEKDPNEVALIAKQFNTITPENMLKWEHVHPEPDKYNFEPVDKLVAFGQKYNMFIVGHVLVWHHQTPDWVFQDANGNDIDRETLLARMKEHISTVVGRYKGRISGWDVVNEALGTDGRLRNSKWLEIIGEDYIQKAFEYAHEADPDAELYYNDYNNWRHRQCQGVIRLVKDLKAKGIRVDGIGIQGHWDLEVPTTDALEAAVKAYSVLDVKLMITEFDLTVLPLATSQSGADISLRVEQSEALNPYPDGLPDEMQKKLADRYADLFSFFHKHHDQFSRITFWGVHDGQSWLNYWPVIGRTDYPLLFDRHYKPKPAFYAVIKTAEGK